MEIVEVKKLSKQYGELLVLDDVSFKLKQGFIYGILGVNGAGKTTLLECIEGLLTYQKGTISICDLSQSSALKDKRYGVQLQSSSLPEFIKVKEVVRLFCKWNNSDRYEVLMNIFDLYDIQNQTYKTLSTGQKRKLHLVLSLVGNPDVVFLDEPTAGLDVEARAEFHRLLLDLKGKRKTIILSSHDMTEVEILCDYIIMIKNKGIFFEGTTEAFRKQKISDYELSIRTVNSKSNKSFMIKSINKEVPKIIQSFTDKGEEITDLKIDKPSLEERFLQVSEEVD